MDGAGEASPKKSMIYFQALADLDPKNAFQRSQVLGALLRSIGVSSLELNSSSLQEVCPK